MKLAQPLKSKKSKMKKLPYTPKGIVFYYIIMWSIVIFIAFSITE